MSIRAAREAKGLTWYAVAKRTGIPNPSTIRGIEHGHDAQLSNVWAVPQMLGLRLELVEEKIVRDIAHVGKDFVRDWEAGVRRQVDDGKSRLGWEF